MNERMDALTGADQLKPCTRSQLLFEQIQAIAQLTPATAAGGFGVSLMVLAVTYGLPVFAAALVWTAALQLALFVALRGWWRGRRVSSRRTASLRAVRAASINAACLGAIWGTLPNLLLPAGDPLLSTITWIILVGVLCATGFALLVLPQAAIAFSIPLLIGTLAAVFGLVDWTERLAMLGLLVVYVLVLALVCIHHVRNLVRHVGSESKIREQKDIISLLLKEFEDNSSDWLWEFDRRGDLHRVSDRFCTASGMTREGLVGLDFHRFLQAVCRENDPVLEELRMDIARRETFSAVELSVTVDGIERFWRIMGKPIFDEFGSYGGYLGTASDVTNEKNAERRINFLAHNDPLTGLLNRAKFSEQMKQAVARLERYGTPFAVLYLDLDQFKAVNDTRGHQVGDKLLVQASRRIRATLRESDVAARLGGDEFAIILGNVYEPAETGALAQRLVETVGKPYEFEGDTVTIGVSIGIALAPLNGNRSDTILRNADLALYRAKAEGRATHRFFEAQMDSDVRERRALEHELRQALTKDEFVLHYQPLVSAEDNRPSGFEALVRWNHPLRGLVQPADFISVAEQSGVIKEIGDWTIREACEAAARWPDELMVAVNLSARHFHLSDIAAVVRDALARSGLAPERLELEITEALLMGQPDEVIDKLAEVKALGVTIAMDDFGSGHASLSNLLKFPFDKLKIDRSFVMASTEDAVARDVLKSIASLGRTLKIRITAEGVETQEQVDFLRDIACAQLQGFYFAKPLDEIDLAHYFLTQFGMPARPSSVAQRLAS